MRFFFFTVENFNPNPYKAHGLEPGLCHVFPGKNPTAQQRMLFFLLLGARWLGLMEENMTLWH